jgi:hypothetical protein
VALVAEDLARSSALIHRRISADRSRNGDRFDWVWVCGIGR